MFNWFKLRRVNKLRKLIHQKNDLLQLEELIKQPLAKNESQRDRNIKIIDPLETIKKDVQFNKMEVADIKKAMVEIDLYIKELQNSIV